MRNHVIMNVFVMTNKVLSMAKKRRRPGGGRKPKGSIRDKREAFSTRITAETRAALEREAAKTGQSISQVAEWALRTGLMEKQRSRTVQPLRAISFLIERLALASCRAAYINAPGKRLQRIETWRSDPFAFSAFKIAVGMLLDFLEPQGPALSPLRANNPRGIAVHPRLSDREWQLVGRFYEAPEAYGAYIYSHLVEELQNESPTFVRQIAMGSPTSGDMATDEYYGLRSARRDLGLDALVEKDQ